MFTLGSKSFLGAALIALAGGVVYAMVSQDQAGVGLLVAGAGGLVALALAVLAGAGATDRYSYDGGADPRPGRAPAPTIVPFVVALAAGVALLGFALGASAFVLGTLALAAGLVVWFAQAWRDHPNYLPQLSTRVSDGVGLPFGMPLVLITLIGFIGVAISRTLLAVSPTNAWIVALILASLVFFGAMVLARPKSLSSTTMKSVVTVFGIIILGLGIYGLAKGKRPIEHEGGEPAGTEHAVESTK